MTNASIHGAAFLVAALALATEAAAQRPAGVVEFDPAYGVGETERLALDAGEAVYLEKGRGPVIVFYYPGFDQRYWQWQVEAAAAQGYRAIALSFAPPAAGTANDLFATAPLASALDRLALGPVHIVAHSIAAWHAMKLASERPELFRTLVLEEPAVGLAGVTPACSLTEASDAERAACLFSSLHSNAGWFERQSPALRSYFAEGFGALVPGDPSQIVFPSICDAVARLPMPILFIRGADTRAHFQARLDEHEACLPEHGSLTISGAAHSVHMSQPEAYNRAVFEFIARHEEQTAGSGSGIASGRASAAGGEIEYFVSGSSDGEAMLLIHGVGLAAALAPLAAEPAFENYRRIRLHRRGYAGSTEPGGPFSMRDQAADAVAVLDALNIERAHIVGHSYGGAITMQMAVQAPERVQSLVLLDTAPPPGLQPAPPPPDAGTSVPMSPAVASAAAAALLRTGDARGAVESFFTFVFGDDWREYFEAVPGGLDQAVADAPVTFEVEGPAMNEWQSRPFDIAAITQPTLILWGPTSPLFPPPVVDAFRGAFPQAELRSIPGTDHALVTQDPAGVAAAIADFLGRHPL